MLNLVKTCNVKECLRKPKSRGLCVSCYQNCRSAVKAGKTTWKELEDAGVSVPARKPGPVSTTLKEICKAALSRDKLSPREVRKPLPPNPPGPAPEPFTGKMPVWPNGSAGTVPFVAPPAEPEEELTSALPMSAWPAGHDVGDDIARIRATGCKPEPRMVSFLDDMARQSPSDLSQKPIDQRLPSWVPSPEPAATIKKVDAPETPQNTDSAPSETCNSVPETQAEDDAALGKALGHVPFKGEQIKALPPLSGLPVDLTAGRYDSIGVTPTSEPLPLPVAKDVCYERTPLGIVCRSKADGLPPTEKIKMSVKSDPGSYEPSRGSTLTDAPPAERVFVSTPSVEPNQFQKMLENGTEQTKEDRETIKGLRGQSAAPIPDEAQDLYPPTRGRTPTALEEAERKQFETGEDLQIDPLEQTPNRFQEMVETGAKQIKEARERIKAARAAAFGEVPARGRTLTPLEVAEQAAKELTVRHELHASSLAEIGDYPIEGPTEGPGPCQVKPDGPTTLPWERIENQPG